MNENYPLVHKSNPNMIHRIKKNTKVSDVITPMKHWIVALLSIFQTISLARFKAFPVLIFDLKDRINLRPMITFQ